MPEYKIFQTLPSAELHTKEFYSISKTLIKYPSTRFATINAAVGTLKPQQNYLIPLGKTIGGHLQRVLHF